jgi:7,8-dihydropterin-6-yl-methyl-4-(beta-D-ribofuranosyl)aminobenzene 5'-phosphate synthase
MLNMIDTVARKFKGIPIKAVIGGFHLVGLPRRNTMAGSKSEIQKITSKVLSYPVQSIYTGHCTGQKAYAVLKSVLGEKLQHLQTGTIIRI